MRHIKLEYPDKSIHNVDVHNFYYNEKEDNYLINYHDLVENKKESAYLKKDDNDFQLISIDNYHENCTYEVIDTTLLPDYVKHIQKDEDTERVTVYKSDYTLFLDENACEQYNIATNANKRIVKGIICREVTEEELTSINASIEYVHVYEVENTKSYSYYELNNILYIPRDIYELIIKSDIKITSKPKIIENKNYYSITENQLTLFNRKYHYYGKKITLEPERTIIYKNANDNKLYIPIENDCLHSDITILNKKCQLVKEDELENLNLPNPIIASVYKNEIPEITREIIVCSYEEKIYIAKDIIDEFNIIPENQQKIKIASNFYLEIKADDLDNLKNQAKNKNTNLKFNIRKIAPKKKSI